MIGINFFGLVLLITIASSHMNTYGYMYEGIPYEVPPGGIDNMNQKAYAFLPFDAHIVEIGAYRGEGTKILAKDFPYGKIFAFEPQTSAFSALVENTKDLPNVWAFNFAIHRYAGNGYLWGDAKCASLIKPKRSKSSELVTCDLLDAFLKRQHIDRVDMLRLDAGGLEWQILQSSPKALSQVIVIVLRTHLFPSQKSILSYPLLKRLLEREGFMMLCHAYEKDRDGEATFIRKHMYNAIFR